MSPHEILAALRAANISLRFGHGGRLHLFYPNGLAIQDKSLLAEFLAQKHAVADLLRETAIVVAERVGLRCSIVARREAE